MGKFDRLFSLNKVILDIGAKSLCAYRIPLYLKLKKSLINNEELKNKKKSDRCFIVGLGPSLKDVDLNSLDGDIIATNRYTMIENAPEPDYYCLLDADFYKDVDGKVMSDAARKFPHTAFILNGKYKREAEKLIGDSVLAFYSLTWAGIFNTKKELDFTKNLPIPQNVVCFAEMFALWMEYKEIILLGCDFNSFASPKPVHCYEEKGSRKYSMAFELFIYSFVADLHYSLEIYAKKHNIRIINATKGSLIDAYEKNDEIVDHYLKK